MFLLTGTIASLIISAIWIFAFIEKKTAGRCIHCIVKNIFVINLVSIAIQRYVLKYRHFLVTDGYKTESFIKFFIVAIVVGFAFMFISALFNNMIAFEKEEPKKSHGARFMKVISAIFVALGTACCYCRPTSDYTFFTYRRHGNFCLCRRFWGSGISGNADYGNFLSFCFR